MMVGYLLAVVFAVVPMAPDQLPVTFVRGGDTVRLQVDLKGIDTSQQMILSAYSYSWTPATAPASLPTTASAMVPVSSSTSSSVTLKVPEVDRTTVFSLATATQPSREVGQIVAYPMLSRWKNARKDEPLKIYGLDVPNWFRQWANANSAPLIETDLNSLECRKVSPDVPELAIIGAKAAGQDCSEVFELVHKANINLLVLEAVWFGTICSQMFEVKPGQMHGRLAQLRTQQWRGPLRFSYFHKPWPGIVNRRLWIEFNGLPLLEQVGPLVADRRIVFSYLPWARQLGRNDLADDLLEYVIRQVAEPVCSDVLLRPLKTVCQVRRLEDSDSMYVDVLDVAGPTLNTNVAQLDALRVIDLRGTDRLSDDQIKVISKEAASIDEEHPLLILGDDPLLNELTWLELDRSKATIIKPIGATWLPDDGWPPSENALIRAMIAITDFRISIETGSKERPS